MFISTIIPTIGRPSLARAVNSVLGQEFDHEACEVIVVNDSGKDLPVEAWQNHPNVRIISTNRHNRSIARNTGAAIASGSYLHFLDDDDWMLPGAFDAFWQATLNSSAAWIHGAFGMVDNDGKKIVDIFPDESGNCLINLVSWEWLPLQASIVEANAFFRVGGFAMLNTLKGGFEDIHLTRQIACQADFMNVPVLVASIRSGDNGSTTNYAHMFNQNRESREQTLDMPGALWRLIDSARKNPRRQGYWHGRVVYYYLGSAERNLRAEKRFFRALSRGFCAVTSLIAAGTYIFTSDFWQGMTKPHYARVWLAIGESGKTLFQNTNWVSS
jgi:glycosyltransferase involved in cell wall biosynthesis